MELSVAVIYTCGEEIGENVVFVRCTNESINGSTHELRNISCENVSEVAGRNAHVDLFSERNSARLVHIAVGGNVVNYLRNESAPVY